MVNWVEIFDDDVCSIIELITKMPDYIKFEDTTQLYNISINTDIFKKYPNEMVDFLCFYMPKTEHQYMIEKIIYDLDKNKNIKRNNKKKLKELIDKYC